MRVWTPVLALAVTACAGHAGVDGDVCAALSSKRIAQALDGEPDVEIPCATVTFVRQALHADPAGIFIQAERDGPALYIEVPLESLEEDFGFVPEEGRLVGLQIDGKRTMVNEVRRTVTGLKALRDLGPGTPLEKLVTNHTSNADLYDDRRKLDFTLVFTSGHIESFFLQSHDGYEAANLNILEDQGEPFWWIVEVKSRFPREEIDHWGIVGDCWIDLGPTPLWPQNGSTGDRIHFTRWRPEQLEIHRCPNAEVRPEQAEDGRIALRLLVPDFGGTDDRAMFTRATRHWHPDVADPSAFKVDGNQATALENHGDHLLLTVPGLDPVPAMEVTIEGRVEDILEHKVFGT